MQLQHTTPTSSLVAFSIRSAVQVFCILTHNTSNIQFDIDDNNIQDKGALVSSGMHFSICRIQMQESTGVKKVD